MIVENLAYTPRVILP